MTDGKDQWPLVDLIAFRLLQLVFAVLLAAFFGVAALGTFLAVQSLFI
ncbi:hypothetical protein [Microcystis phage Mel-JY03]